MVLNLLNFVSKLELLFLRDLGEVMVNNLTPNLLKRLILKLESVICCFWWKTLVSHFIITYVTKRNISCLAVGSTSSKCLLVSWILFVTLVFLNHWIIIRAFFFWNISKYDDDLETKMKGSYCMEHSCEALIACNKCIRYLIIMMGHW